LALAFLVAAIQCIPLGSIGLSTESMAAPVCNVEEDGSLPSMFIIRDVSISEVWWAATVIVLDIGGNRIDWHPTQPPLESGEQAIESLVSSGTYCNVTDKTGDGFVNKGDFFIIDYVTAPPANALPSELVLVYEPTGEAMWRGLFQDGRIPYEAWPSRPSNMVVWVVILCAVVIVFVAGGLILRKANSK